MNKDPRRVGAVVLAAGRSRRMGRPKMTLPWGRRTVIEQVVQTLAAADVDPVVVVTGGGREEVEAALAGCAVQMVFNSDYEQGEMLSSLKKGLGKALLSCSHPLAAALVVLGDQPGIQESVVREIIGAFRASGARLVVPSYRRRRGHPWLLERSLWNDLLALPTEQTMRDFLQEHESEIEYVVVDTPGILKDVDTPEDYHSQRPD